MRAGMVVIGTNFWKRSREERERTVLFLSKEHYQSQRVLN